MFSIWQEMFSYSFMVRAIVVGSAVSLCAALLGVSLVLKRYSMIGDGLSHVGFGALSIAMAMNLAPLKIAVPVVVIAAFFLLRISQNSKIKGDAAIGLISSTSIAIGVTVTSLTSGLNADIKISIVLSVLVFILFVIFYDRIFATTFDENFAKATGVKVELYNMLIAFLTAITIVLGMRIMGTMLISSLIIFPALTSMRVFNSFKSVIISSGIISVACFFIGMTVSFLYSTPAGASVVLVNAVAFLIFSVIGMVTKRI